MRRARRAESGNAILPVIVIVVICVAMAAGLILPGLAESRESQADLSRERAFQLSEAGIDWAIARVRSAKGAIPSPPSETRAVGTVGSFVLSYASGAGNGLDDDGDGTTDEADESDFVFVTSTGDANGARRTHRVVLRRNVQIPEVDAAIQFNVTTPIVDLKGNAFLISGADHDLTGAVDPLLAQKPGMASPAPPVDLISQIAASRQDQVQGAGGAPSVATLPAIDLDALVDQAKSAASLIVEPGTHTGLALGTPTAAGVVVAHCDDDLHLSGDATGAGILIVDGDLRISGSFTWTGLLLVRGRLEMTGGGHSKRVIGGVLIGQEITTSDDSSEVTVTGTVDLLYSSAAIQLAAQSLVMMSVLSWNETGNP
jgi:hypothetical protein